MPVGDDVAVDVVVVVVDVVAELDFGRYLIPVLGQLEVEPRASTAW